MEIQLLGGLGNGEFCLFHYPLNFIFISHERNLRRTLQDCPVSGTISFDSKKSELRIDGL